MEYLFFDRLKKAQQDIVKFLEQYQFEPNDEKTRESIIYWIKKYLDENELGSWDIEFRGGLGYTVILKPIELELMFFVKG